jgi:hypothetical protein
MATRVFYRRTLNLIATSVVRLDAQTRVLPGDPLPSTVREFHRRSLYMRRLVGDANDPWTKARLELYRSKRLAELESQDDLNAADQEELERLYDILDSEVDQAEVDRLIEEKQAAEEAELARMIAEEQAALLRKAEFDALPGPSETQLDALREAVLLEDESTKLDKIPDLND